MAERIILKVSGWCECDPERVRFQYTGPRDDASCIITGTELLALPDEDRCEYVLESSVDAIATALDGEQEWEVSVEV